MTTPAHADPAAASSSAALSGPAAGKAESEPALRASNDPTSATARAAEDAAGWILQAAGIDQVDLACTMGSGWSAATDSLGEVIADLDAYDVPGFAVSGVPGHAGRLQVVQHSSGGHVLVIGARTHFYEQRDVDAVAHGVRTAASAGARTMILTNGCGGLREDIPAGTPVLIADHLNLTGTSPLRGAHFVDMTDLYSPRLRELALEVDNQLGEGVYAQLPGPHYETPAEIRYLKTCGADLVGMSTALEAIAARAENLEVLGISLVTNLAAGISPQPLSHQEVIDAGRAAAGRISVLLSDIITAELRQLIQGEDS